MLFQILDHGKHHGLILIVLRESQGGKVRQAADVMNVTLHIPLHFQSTLVILECKHGAPIHPEIGVKDFLIEQLCHFYIVQLLVRSHEQLHNFHAALVRQAKPLASVGILALILGCPAQGIVGVFLVQPVVFVQNADTIGFDGRNGAEQVPHAFEVVVHLPSAPHNIAHTGHLVAIQSTAWAGIPFQNMNMFSGHLGIPNHKTSRRKGGQSAANQIGGFVVNTLWLFGSCKCFIITAGIIHNKYLHISWF